MKEFAKAFPEVVIAAGLLVLTLLFSVVIGAPLSLPSGNRASFVGIHYIYPMLGVAIWGIFAAFGQRKRLAMTFLVALPSYALVIICHFNLKLWRPFINAYEWDSIYWHLDQTLYPIVAACMWIRSTLFPIIPADSNFYMIAFIAMFYLSFCVHALRDQANYRKLIIAALIFQASGGIAYLIMPALGPFIYETGVEPGQSVAQAGMLGSYREMTAQGTSWLIENGGARLTVGLAAMPSLHTGGSFLFLLFAWRYARILVPLYLFLFGFIAVDAIANRWHYIVDLPVGVLLAFGSAWIAEKIAPSALAASSAPDTPPPLAAGA